MDQKPTSFKTWSESPNLSMESKPQPERAASKPILSTTKAGSKHLGNKSQNIVTIVELESERQAVNQHDKIHWRSPFTMVAFFFAAVVAGLSHHVYYLSLDGKQVGSDKSQQWYLRWGNTFAFIFQACLVASVSFAYTQWLFRSLKRTKVTLGTIDAAFNAESSVLSLLQSDMLFKIKVASFLALVIWCLPLSSLVTPATLYVLPSLETTWAEAAVPSLDMYSPSQPKTFSYTVVSGSGNTQRAKFLGPRTIVSRLSTATATTGMILPISAPLENSSYTLQFYGPSIQCEEPNSTIVDTIQQRRLASVQSFNGNVRENANHYFAMVPDLSSHPDADASSTNISIDSPRLRQQQPGLGSNQLWMVYSRYVVSPESQYSIEDHYSVCQLYNASYKINITFSNGNQTISDFGTKPLNRVHFPQFSDPYSNDLMVQHAYSATFWSITDLLIGSMGVFTETTNITSETAANTITVFSEITTQIEYTSLIGSSDLDAFFDANHRLSSSTPSNSSSAQRAQDIALAGNQTLDVLITELCYNTTLSFLSNGLLSPSLPKPLTLTTSINRYAYRSRNLVLSYGLALFFALIGNILGAYAYKTNGASHSKSFSAILALTRDMGSDFLRVKGERKGEFKKQTLCLGVKDDGWGFERA